MVDSPAMRLWAGLAGCATFSLSVILLWRTPAAPLLFLALLPLTVLAARNVARQGVRSFGVFIGFSGLAGLSRWLHGTTTACWYVDYLGPVYSEARPEVKLDAGLAGLLRGLSRFSYVDP